MHRVSILLHRALESVDVLPPLGAAVLQVEDAGGDIAGGSCLEERVLDLGVCIKFGVFASLIEGGILVAVYSYRQKA